MTTRKPYPSDVSDEEWALVVPYLTLLREDAGQRDHPLREVFNGLRYLVKNGIPWRAMPHDLPPLAGLEPALLRRRIARLRLTMGGGPPAGPALAAGCFELLAHDLRAVLRLATGRAEEPSAAVLDSRTLRSTPESGARAGWDGHKRTRGSKLHLAVDTLGHLLALHVTPASANDRAAVAELAEAVQDATGGKVELAFVDQGDTGERPAEAAQAHGIALAVVSLPEAIAQRSPGGTGRAAARRRGFVLLPRRWVVIARTILPTCTLSGRP
jgi:transposase